MTEKSKAVPESPVEPVKSIRRTHDRTGAPLPNRVRQPVQVIDDDEPCSKCGALLDTGLECTECGHDMMPELVPTTQAPVAAEGASDKAATITSLIAQIRAAKSMARRDALFEKIIEVWEAAPAPAVGASRALADLRHLYANMMMGAVKDTASAKRIATGLLSPAIQLLENANKGNK